MELYRKFLILFIILCFTYILFRLLQKRRQLFNEKVLISQGQGQQEGFIEGATSYFPSFSFFSTENSELAGIKSSVPSTIVNFDPTISNLPICQYIIKSSYCTPFTGSWVNLDAIIYALSRGCRFIDIEIYMVNNVVVVAQSTDSTNTTIGSKNTLLLDDVLNCIALNAFMGGSCPNPKDPLFLQFRIKTTATDINKYCAMSIQKNLSKLLYSDKKGNKQISPSTKIGDLMGSIIIIIDKTVAPDWASSPDCENSKTTCYNLVNYANMVSGQPQLKTTTYTNILDQKTTPHTVIDDTILLADQTVDIQNLKMVTPPIASSVNNPNSDKLITNYGVNIICFQFFLLDYNLANYEQIFSDNNSAFVSFAQYASNTIQS